MNLNQINDYSANIATDPVYDRGKVIKAARRAPHRVVNSVNYSRDSIELKRLHLVVITFHIGYTVTVHMNCLKFLL